jgi:hypothetical protein
LTVHSGVTGQGQQLRHAFEGTGINTAGLSFRLTCLPCARLLLACIRISPIWTTSRSRLPSA